MAKRGRAPSEFTETIVVKVTLQLKDRIESAAGTLVPSGLEASTAEVARLLIVRGLESMQPEQVPASPLQQVYR